MSSNLVKERVDDMNKKFDLKVIIVIVLVLALIVGFFTDKINSNEFIPLVSIVLTFYFTSKKKDEEK